MPTRDTLHEPPTWPVCSVDDCIGIRINGEELCLAHLDSGGRAKFVASLKPKAELDLRGTNINADLVRDILKAVEVDPVGWRLLGTVNFRAAKFDGNIDFGQTTFDGEAWFDEAEFGDKTVFERTEFKSNASFYRVRFIGDVSFYRVDFSAPTRFNEARFDRKTEFFGVRFNGFAAFSRSQFRYTTWFHEAQFADTASFIESRFSGKAGFVRASFSGDALFHGTAFEDVINFGESRFQKEARFDGVMCNDALWFNKAQFGASPNIGPLLAANELVFDDATFNGPCIIEAATSRLSCIRARFEGPATLRIRWAEVVLDDCLFPEPSILTFAEEFRDQRALFGQDNKLFDETKFTTNATTPRPKLLSLRRADASNLTLLDVNLTRCLFESTYYLDRLQIAGVCDFPTTPIGWQFARLGGQGLPVWRWTFRRTIADEHKLRANRSIPVPGRSSRSGKSWHSQLLNG